MGRIFVGRGGRREEIGNVTDGHVIWYATDARGPGRGSGW